jgi:hypothetical protein
LDKTATDRTDTTDSSEPGRDGFGISFPQVLVLKKKSV